MKIIFNEFIRNSSPVLRYRFNRIERKEFKNKKEAERYLTQQLGSTMLDHTVIE